MFFCLGGPSALCGCSLLENGDRISGIIKEIWGDILIIEPEYSDPIELDRAIVTGIESDRELAIELDGSKETPYLMSRSLKEGRVVLDAEDTKFDVALDSIKRAEEIKDFDWDIKFDLGSTSVEAILKPNYEFTVGWEFDH